ncbi:FHA domain-containing protein [Argonema galeatum]|uniref:FHA domain-containing protein n=1 Tax=Argonema galeatum TaxID=2942762 RepID=UPI00201233C0|nr:FHA domain-containing protein [Argonema galeatum]MCL1468081.1 FHA domain-containing protein [Argonema galeatum A003/A1]
MNELTLEWQEAGHLRKQMIRDRQLSKNAGTVRLGRDALRCDIVLTHPTVSGLHVEIFFNQEQQQFYLRNLRESNPPWVNGKQLTVGETTLSQGSIFHLGETEIKVSGVILAGSSVPPTILVSPLAPWKVSQPSGATVANQTYGLRCPNSKCDRISPYERLDLGCPWCGTSLTAAASVLMTPSGNQPL